MLYTGTYGVDSKTPDEVTNSFALAIVAAQLLSGDTNNVLKWNAVDESFPQVHFKNNLKTKKSHYKVAYMRSCSKIE